MHMGAQVSFPLLPPLKCFFFIIIIIIIRLEKRVQIEKDEDLN